MGSSLCHASCVPRLVMYDGFLALSCLMGTSLTHVSWIPRLLMFRGFLCLLMFRGFDVFRGFVAL